MKQEKKTREYNKRTKAIKQNKITKQENETRK